MLYKITQADIREDNNNIDATPEFIDLHSRELKYIFLVYDFDSPLKQLSLEDRKEQAAENAGYKRENPKRMDRNARNLINGKIKKVLDAIPAFKRQLRDLDREALEAFDINLEHYIKKIREPKIEAKDWDINIKIIKEYEKLLIARKRIIDNLNLRADFVDDTEDVDDGELSTLDKVNEKLISS